MSWQRENKSQHQRQGDTKRVTVYRIIHAVSTPYDAVGVYEVCPPAHCRAAVRLAEDGNFPLSICRLKDLPYLDARALCVCVCVFTRSSRISKYLFRNPGAAEGFPEGCMKSVCAIALPLRKDNEICKRGYVIFSLSSDRLCRGRCVR